MGDFPTVLFSISHIFVLIFVSKSMLLFGVGKVTIFCHRRAVQFRTRGYDFVGVKSRLGGCIVYLGSLSMVTCGYLDHCIIDINRGNWHILSS